MPEGSPCRSSLICDIGGVKGNSQGSRSRRTGDGVKNVRSGSVRACAATGHHPDDVVVAQPDGCGEQCVASSRQDKIHIF